MKELLREFEFSVVPFFNFFFAKIDCFAWFIDLRAFQRRIKNEYIVDQFSGSLTLHFQIAPKMSSIKVIQKHIYRCIDIKIYKG